MSAFQLNLNEAIRRADLHPTSWATALAKHTRRISSVRLRFFQSIVKQAFGIALPREAPISGLSMTLYRIFFPLWLLKDA